MNKNNVDRFFASGLSNLEVSPSSNTDARFNALLEKRKSGRGAIINFVRYFSAAASVIFVFGMGFYFHQANNNSKTLNVASVSDNLNLPKPLENESEVLNSIKEEQIIALNSKQSFVDNSANKKLPVISKGNVLSPHNDISPESLKTESALPAKKASGVYETDEQIPDGLTLALQNAETKRNQRIREDKEDRLFRKDVGETLIVISSEKNPNEERIHLPELNEDSPITLTEARALGEIKKENNKGVLAKVFYQIRSLKHGEKPDRDFSESVSRNTLHFSDDGFIGNEAKEMKERFNWIKDKISKN